MVPIGAESGLRLVLVAAVALVDADGRVLLARRPEGKSMAGLWEFPGGKVHDGEAPETALIRELKEELAIDVAESCLAPFAFASHRYQDFHLLMQLYVCRSWSGADSRCRRIRTARAVRRPRTRGCAPRGPWGRRTQWPGNRLAVQGCLGTGGARMSDLPRKAVTRTAKLAALPLGMAGRATWGLGKRIGGKSAEIVAREL